MNWSAVTVALVPPGVVTKILRVASASAGENAVICVLETTVKLGEAVGPKATLVAPVKLVPVMVTDVPPLPGPDFGETAVTLGAPAL